MIQIILFNRNESLLEVWQYKTSQVNLMIFENTHYSNKNLIFSQVTIYILNGHQKGIPRMKK